MTGEKVLFCNRCLYSNYHQLGIVLDAEGICSGCRIHEEKDFLDWDYRFRLLERIVEDYKLKASNNYDCIVPVTGAQDSYFTMHVVKNVLKLNPLMVSYNKYYNTPLGIRNLANLRLAFDCDLLVQNISRASVLRITKTTLRELGSLYWPVLAGHSVFPVQIAVKKKIPLIIWGAHQGIEQVGMFSHESEVEMTRRYRKDHDLMGVEADDLLSLFDSVKEEDVWQYRYPENDELSKVGVRGIYLSNYIRWDPLTQHRQMVEIYSYEGANFNRTFDTYDFTDCYNYMGLHDLLKLHKHGYSKVTDHACREIRHGRISRGVACELVKKYEQNQPQNMDLFCDYLNIPEASLHYMIDFHRNPKFWRPDNSGSHTCFAGISVLRSNQSTSDGADLAEKNRKELAAANYVRGSLERDQVRGYVTYGKGWP